MAIVDIRGVGKARFPDEMPVNDVRSFLQRKFPPIAQPQGFQPSLTPGVAGAAAPSVVDPFKRERILMQQRQQERTEFEARQIGGPGIKEQGLGEVAIPGLEDTPRDIAFTAQALRQGDIGGVAIGAAGTLIPGLSAAKLGAILPFVRKGEKVLTGDSGVPNLLSIDEAVRKMDRTTEGAIDLQAVRKALSKNDADTLVEVEVDPRELKIENANPAFANFDKGSIIIDAEGAVIDGNHRAAAALQRGETIKAFRPDKTDTLVDRFEKGEFKTQ